MLYWVERLESWQLLSSGSTRHGLNGPLYIQNQFHVRVRTLLIEWSSVSIAFQLGVFLDG